MATKELTYQVECGPEDILYTFVYEIEPYNAGGRDEPPSGGNADVYEVRGPDGKEIAREAWKGLGIDVEKVEEAIYVKWCDEGEDDDDPAGWEPIDRRQDDPNDD